MSRLRTGRYLFLLVILAPLVTGVGMGIGAVLTGFVPPWLIVVVNVIVGIGFGFAAIGLFRPWYMAPRTSGERSGESS